MRLYGSDADLWEALRDPNDLYDEAVALWHLLSASASHEIESLLEWAAVAVHWHVVYRFPLTCCSQTSLQKCLRFQKNAIRTEDMPSQI